ncbi:carboxypeptidase-like regulatory domain-containing protein [bacterium]|nr:carboxypeptidase-like regulatory domain-containing protein [bacterium]
MIPKFIILSATLIYLASCANSRNGTSVVAEKYSYDDCEIIQFPKDCVFVVGLITHRYSGDVGNYSNIYIRNANLMKSDSFYVKDTLLNINNTFNGQSVFCNSSTYATSADSNGVFRIALPPGKYYFEVQHLGATRLITKSILLKGSHRYTFTFNLGTVITECN